MKELWDLFCVFAKVGGFTFGGGYAMLPLLQREVVENKGWAEEQELLDYYGIGQCTPGIIAVNVATFIGYKQKGLLGGIVATIGVIAPSMVIITLIASCLERLMDEPVVIHAVAGIQVCVCVLILQAVIGLAKKSAMDGGSIAIFLGAFLLAVGTDIPIAFVVVSAGLLGCVFRVIREKRRTGGTK